MQSSTSAKMRAAHFLTTNSTMKTSLIIGVMLASVLLGGCGKKGGTTYSSIRFLEPGHSPEELVAQCPVIIYTSADTNNIPNLRLVVREIWKGKDEASGLGITNGMTFPFQWPTNHGLPPDGAVVFITPGVNPSTQFTAPNPDKDSPMPAWMKMVAFSHDGKIKNMSPQDFKTKLGL
jgi:hypothetical protein